MVDMTSKNFDKYVVLYLNGDFVGSNDVDKLRDMFRAISHQTNNIIIDLQGVSYLNSTSLGAFLSANAMFEKEGGKALICNLSNYLKNIFQITKLTLIFTIYDSVEDALKAL
jgi:anti-sigma B factor antagonist